jgi:hypothetical protein
LHTHNEPILGKAACRRELDGILLNLADGIMERKKRNRLMKMWRR